MSPEHPETPAEAAALRAAADAAWSAFRQTPAWDALRLQFETFRTEAIRAMGKLGGLSCCDRAVLAGQLHVYQAFLSSPDQALQRLRMRHDQHPPLGPATSMPAEVAS